MQHFRLTLACGHYFEETAVDFHGTDEHGEPKPYQPDYTGRVLRCQHPACRKNAKVTAQEPVDHLTGILNLPNAPKAVQATEESAEPPAPQE
jgi:hypothetical protein